MNKTYIIGLAVAVVIAIGGYQFPWVQTQVEQPTKQPTGAIASPDIQSEYLKFNGTEVWYRSQPFHTSSTTRCALRAPTHATSTLALDGIVKAATTTNFTLSIAKDATPYATTTQIRSETVTVNTQVAFPTASTTWSAAADTSRTFGPGEYFVVSTAGPTPTAFDNGYCSAIFIVGR